VLLTVAGFHDPVIPLSDVLGNAGTASPLQIVSEVPNENTGVAFGFTVTVNVVVVAQVPADGVNVYVSDAVVLTVAGFQVPVIPLEEVAGRAGTVPPEQMVKLLPKLNVGVTFGLTVTVNVALKAH
jgi:hypothetical protein